MILKRIKDKWDKWSRQDWNDNMTIIEKNFNNVVDVVSNQAYNQVVESATLIWKEPVNTFSDLANEYPNAEAGWTVMAREVVTGFDDKGVNKVYRYNGSEWTEIQQILADAVNEVDYRLTSQLDQIDEQVQKNALYPLDIPTYEGSGQTVHPDVISIPGGFKSTGVGYLMAHTPYPNTNDDYENPSLVGSYNGVHFFDLGTNPIDQPTNEQHAQGLHMSDAVLVYRAELEQIEMYYRLSKDDGTFEQILRKTTTDLYNWSEREVIYDASNQYLVLSPSLLYEDNLYKMWFISQGKMWFTTSTTGNLDTWSVRQEVRINFKNESHPLWHLDVYKNRQGIYILLLNTTDRLLMVAESLDGQSFDDCRVILKPTLLPSTWDATYIYRASVIEVGAGYRVYYSAYDGTWHIGAIQGLTLDTLKSFSYDKYNELARDRIVANEYQLSRKHSNAKLKHDELLFYTSGVGSVRLKNPSSNILRLENQSGDGLGRFEASELTGILKIPISTNILQSIAFLKHDALQFYTAGIKGVRLFNGDANTLDILASDSNSQYAHLKIASLQFISQSGVQAVEGSVRYNHTTKKHQGYDGSEWHDFY